MNDSGLSYLRFPHDFRRTALRRDHFSLTIAKQDMLIDTATGPWFNTFLKVSAALGTRRGEVLALRWREIVDGRAIVARSLTRHLVSLKDTKTEDAGVLALPADALTALETPPQMLGSDILPMRRNFYNGSWRAS